MDQLTRVKDLPVPEFGTLHAWEARASAAVRAANGDSGAIDPSKSSQGLGYGGTSLPFVGDTKVEVAFSGTEGKGENIKSETESSSLKVLPPWMIKEGMNLTKEQWGEVKQELRMDGSSAAVEFSDDKKATIENDDKKNIQDEYIKAYYAALLKKQQELDEAAKKEHELSNTQSLKDVSDTTSNCQVQIKSKRDADEGDDDVEWEESPVAGSSAKQLTENKEIGIQYIKQILGLQQHKEYTNVKSLRYGHLMIMTDQDHDGSHIKGLVINFIHSYWPSLLKVPSLVIEFITSIVKATHKNGTQLSLYTMPKYESWKHNLTGNASGWSIKYYKCEGKKQLLLGL